MPKLKNLYKVGGSDIAALVRKRLKAKVKKAKPHAHVNVRQHYRANPEFFGPAIRVKEHVRGKAPSPDKRARAAALRKAMIVALRELPEADIIDVLTDNWSTLDRLDQLKARFP